MANVQAILKRAAELRGLRRPKEQHSIGGPPKGPSFTRGSGDGGASGMDPLGGGGGGDGNDLLKKPKGAEEQVGLPSVGAGGGASSLPAGASAKEASGERKYTLHEALAIFVKGAQLAVAEKEAAEHAQRKTDSVDEQAMIYARDLLKAAATLNAEN